MKTLIKELSGSYTRKGRKWWFNHKRHKLGGKTPLEAIKDGQYDKVLNLSMWLRDGMSS